MKNINRQDGGRVGQRFARQQQARFGAPSPVDLKGTGWSRRREQTILKTEEVTNNDRVVLARLGAEVLECKEWLTAHGMRAQSIIATVEHVEGQRRPNIRDAFVFKKRKHAALFKLAWG